MNLANDIASHMALSFPFVLVRKGTNGGHFEEETSKIARTIFGLLDMESLINCRDVSLAWRSFIDADTNLWKRATNMEYWSALKSGKLELCKLIINNRQDKSPRNGWGETPLHLAARYTQY